MATARPKESSAHGKEKVLSSNSQSTSTKKNPKPCITGDKPASSSTSPSSEKQIPNYLKPTISSRLESHSHSFKNSKIDSSQKPAINRRRSLDKPPSPSQLTKHSQSSSRLQKALVSPGPRERSGAQLRSASFTARSTVASKSTSERTSKTPKDEKLFARSVKKSRKSPSPTPKKVARDGSTAAYSTKDPKSNAETAEASKNVETEAEVKDTSNEKVEELVMEDDNKQESENVSDQINPPLVDPENEHEHKKECEQDQVVEESKPGEPQIQADSDSNNVFPTASEEVEEEAKAVSVAEDAKLVVEGEEPEKEDPLEEKAEHVHQEDENKSPDESVDHPEPEAEKADVEEKDIGVTEEQESGNKSQNNKEEKAEEEKEGVEGEADEGVKVEGEADEGVEVEGEADGGVEVEGEADGGVKVEGEADEGIKLKEGEDDDDDNVDKSEVKEVKTESTPPKQQEGAGQGKKESTQVSNDVIEETASKLEKRTNKVRALAGAFQTVIDHQSK